MDLQERAARLAALMEERLDIRGQGLAVKHARAGRRLPRWVHREVAAVLEALQMSEAPKLARQVDFAKVETGAARVEAWLLTIDPWERRRAIVLSWLAKNAMNLILVVGLVLAVMAWRGLL